MGHAGSLYPEDHGSRLIMRWLGMLRCLMFAVWLSRDCKRCVRVADGSTCVSNRGRPWDENDCKWYGPDDEGGALCIPLIQRRR